jgi:hypothetical protein
MWRASISLILFFGALIHAYNITQLTTCVLLSGAAYCDDYSRAGLEDMTILYDRETDIRGFAGVKDDRFFIALRGSASIENWIDDFEIRLVDYDRCADCKVHRGFYRSALAIKQQALASLNGNILPIIVTGHSYGAAVAQILALELADDFPDISVVNFGQPRTGNPEFASHLNDVIGDYTRVVHYKDIVPHLPPQPFYKHSCGEIFEDHDGALTECSLEDCEDTRCSQQFSLLQTDASDHLYYLGHRVTCAN